MTVIVILVLAIPLLVFLGWCAGFKAGKIAGWEEAMNELEE